ncbi:MAG: hypothetical protein ACYC4K_10090, partial [Thiobacillus sp.]
MQCPCTPGIVATALEQFSSAMPADFTLDAQTAFDPVLTVRLRHFQAAADASATLADTNPLLRAMLLAAPIAEGGSLPQYAERWYRSIQVASMTRELAKRSGMVALDLAWLAGLTHNLADYAQLSTPSLREDLDEHRLAEISAA